MGDFNRNGQLFIVMKDGSFRALESVTFSTRVENTYEFDKCCCGFNVRATGVMKHIKTIEGYETNMDAIDTDVLVAARDNLNKIIEERKKKEALEEARKKLEEQIYKSFNLPPMPEFKHRLKTIDDGVMSIATCEFEPNWLKSYIATDIALTKDAFAVTMATSNLPKVDSKNNGFSSRIKPTKYFINEDKKIVTVKKPDGSVIQVKCDKRDEFDPYVGVALAMAYKEFGSKAAFRKYVDTNVTKQSKKNKKEEK